MDLTPEELSKYAQLTTTGVLKDYDDIDVGQEKYPGDEEYQRTVLGMLVNDQHFLISSLGLVDSEYFVNDVHKFVCKFAFTHYQKYNCLPKKLYVVQEVENHIKNRQDSTKVYWRAEVNTVYQYYVPGLEDREYLLDKITEFAKTQALKKGVIESLEILKEVGESKWSKVHEVLKTAMSVDRNFDFGMDYFQSGEERYKRIMEAAAKGDVFITGFESIDSNLQGGGLVRGEIGAWIGLSGSGKSLALVKNCIANLNKGRKVLYISLEINTDRVAERFDSMLTHPYGFGINNLIPNRDAILSALGEYVDDYEDKRRLVIKQFPARTMDVATFRAYYHQVRMRGFIPDLVIIDYVGEMKDYPNMPRWESRFQIVGDLRGIASQENIVIFTALQPDKSAKQLVREGRLIDDDNLADAYGQVRPLDCLWSLNRDQPDIECGQARIKVIKHRSGKTQFHFHISIDKGTLWMDETSESRYKEVRNKFCQAQKISTDELELRSAFKKKKTSKEEVVENPSSPE